MKKLIFTLLTLFATSTFANTCSIVIPTAPGGSNDMAIKPLQKQNADMIVMYHPGGFNSGGVNKLKQNPEVGLFSNMIMFASQAPIKDPHLDLQKVLLTVPNGVYSAKHKNFDVILTNKKLNVGVAFFGGPAHHVALEMQSINPNIEIIPFGADAKAIPSIVMGEIDYYVTGLNIVDQMIGLNINVVSTTPEITVGTKKINTVTWFGLWTSKDATDSQRKQINECFDKGINATSISELTTTYTKVVNITGPKKDAMLKDFISLSEKYGRR